MNSISLKTGGGLSAYEVAVKNGFKGTEAEWLQSIKQPALDAADVATNAANNANDKALLAQNAANNANDIVNIIELTNQKIIDEEEKRKTQETNRVNKESERVTAETNRVSTEILRVASENERVESETTRVSNEQARATAETSRVEAEGVRVIAEEGRVSAETLRVEKDATRDVKLAELEAKIKLLESAMISKFGIVYFDYPNSRYLAFADSIARDTYLSDPENNYNLVLGKWGFNISEVTLTFTNTAVNEPLVNTKITIEGEEKLTNETGQVSYYLSKGNYKIHVDHPKADVKEITVVENVENIRLDYELFDTDKTYMVFTVTDNQTIDLSNYMDGINQVNWGDGTIDNNTSHIYATRGEYDVIISHSVDSMFFWQYCNFLKEVKSIGKLNQFDFSYCFSRCYYLTNIHAGVFDNCLSVTKFERCFEGCTSLTSIPQGLFDNCTNVTNFVGCFGGCGKLTTIPSGLFDKNINVTSCIGCFSGCAALDQPYNCTSPGLPKLWEREGVNGEYFAEGAHTTFRATVPTDWGGNLNLVTITTKDKSASNALLSGVEVTINGETKTTNANGLVDFYLLDGSYTVSFKHNKFEILKEQALTVSANNQTVEYLLEEYTPPTIYTTKSTTTGVRFTSVQPGAYIDWGDGTTTDVLNTGTTWNDHTYTDGIEEHTVTIEGSYVIYYSPTSTTTTTTYQAFKNIYKLVQLTGSNTSYNSSFYKSGLVEIDPLILKYSNITSAIGLFSYCDSLVTIPQGLFDYNVNVTNFSYCFHGCSNLTDIPSGLFDNNVNTTNFSYCFRDCRSLTSIPQGLFDNNVNVTNFAGCFQSCSSLTTIPQGLFDYNVNVTSFNYLFSGCTLLTSIPEGLFDNNVNVTSFYDCFFSCRSLTSIPEGLFDYNVNVTNFSYCFQSCSSLTSIPEGLFDKNINVTSCIGCFSGCAALDQPYNCTSTNLPKLWERNGTNGAVKVTDYANFASSAHSVFRNTVPTAWGGTMVI